MSVLGRTFDRWARLARLSNEEWERLVKEAEQREQYEQEQIATAQSEQALEANIKEHNRE